MGGLDEICYDEVHAPIYSYLGHWNRTSVMQSVCWLSLQGYISPSVNGLCFLSWGQSFSLHLLKEIALGCKCRCPSPSLPGSQNCSPEDIRKGVNLEGEGRGRNAGLEAEADTSYLGVVLLPASDGLTTGFLHCSSVWITRCPSGEGRRVIWDKDCLKDETHVSQMVPSSEKFIQAYKGYPVAAAS